MIEKINHTKKYYNKIYKGPKIDWKLYKRNRFYSWYVAILYILGILPAKVIVQEVTVQDYKARNKTKMLFEELNFINRSKSKSIEDIKNHKNSLNFFIKAHLLSIIILSYLQIRFNGLFVPIVAQA